MMRVEDFIELYPAMAADGIITSKKIPGIITVGEVEELLEKAESDRNILYFLAEYSVNGGLEGKVSKKTSAERIDLVNACHTLAESLIMEGQRRGHALCGLKTLQAFSEGRISALEKIANSTRSAQQGEIWDKCASWGHDALDSGYSQAPSVQKVKDWYNKAIAYGHDASMTALGVLLYTYAQDGSEEIQEALDLWEKAEANGDENATFNLSQALNMGDDLECELSV